MKAAKRPGWLLRRLMSPQGLALHLLLHARRSEWTITPKRRPFCTAWHLDYQGAHTLTYYVSQSFAELDTVPTNVLTYWDRWALTPIVRAEITRYQNIAKSQVVAGISEAAK